MGRTMEFDLLPWAILIPLLIVVFWAGFIFGTRRGKTRIKDDEKFGVDSRLRLALDQVTDDSKAIAKIQADIDQLRILIKAKAKRVVLEPIIEKAEANAQALAISNRTTDHILTADRPEFRNETPLVPKA